MLLAVLILLSYGVPVNISNSYHMQLSLYELETMKLGGQEKRTELDRERDSGE